MLVKLILSVYTSVQWSGHVAVYYVEQDCKGYIGLGSVVGILQEVFGPLSPVE